LLVALGGGRRRFIAIELAVGCLKIAKPPVRFSVVKTGFILGLIKGPGARR
jgi:hypothetical protein